MLKNKKAFKTIVVILLAGISFAALFTFPFVLKLSSFYKDAGDYPFSGWILWHNQRAIKTGMILSQASYFSANQFYVYPNSFAFGDYFFIPSLLFAPLYWLSKNIVFSTNLLAFTSMVLNFVFSFFSINHFVRNNYGSVIGALIYTFNPLTWAHFPDHLIFANKYFLPMLFLSTFLFLGRPTWIYAVFFAFLFMLNGLSLIYFEIFSIVLLPLFALPFLLRNLLEKDYHYFIQLFRKGSVILISVAILLYLNLPFLEFSKKENVIRQLYETRRYSARVVDWISSVPESYPYGGFVESIDPGRLPRESDGSFNYAEHTLFPNLIPSILFIVAAYFFWKQRRSKGRKESKMWLSSFVTVLVAAFVFTFGPFFSDTWLILPYYFLYKFLPIVDGIRVPTRFQFMFYVPFSLFCAFGFIGLARYLKLKERALRIFFIIIILLLFFENVTQRTYAEVSGTYNQIRRYRETESEVIKLLEGQNTLHFPIFKDEKMFSNARYLTWSTTTGERLLNGYAGYFPLDVMTLVSEKENLEHEFLEKLYLLDVRYLVIHRDMFESETTEAAYTEEKIDGDLKDSIVFDDENIAVVDLKKMNFDARACDEKSTSVDWELEFPDNLLFGSPLRSILIIKNNSDCYLVFKGDERYIRSKNVIDNRKHTSYFKPPLLVEPGGSAAVSSEILRVKDRFDYIRPGIYEVVIAVELEDRILKKNFTLTVDTL